MYIPQHFKVTDSVKIIEFLKENAFGQLTSIVEGKLVASNLPFLIDQNGKKLLGHLARTNPQWHTLEEQEVLISFQGPHDYISPSWYKSAGVPTWNYQSVHIYGNCKIIDKADQIKTIVNKLTHFYESQFSKPWFADYSSTMLQAIIGIEIEVTDIQCKFKINQNRSKEDRLNVIKQLELNHSTALAKAMRKNEFKL